MVYACDIGVHKWDKNDIEQIISTSNKKQENHIDFSKTETVTWDLNVSNDDISPEYIIQFQNVELLNSKHFKYRKSDLLEEIRKLNI